MLNVHQCRRLDTLNFAYSFDLFALQIQAGVNIEGPKIEIYNGQETEVWPRVVWSPKWALTFCDVKRKVKGLCQISQKSTLVLDGDNVTLENLVLDGALFIRATGGSQVSVNHESRLSNLEHVNIS